MEIQGGLLWKSSGIPVDIQGKSPTRQLDNSTTRQLANSTTRHTNRPARARHSCLRFPHLKKRYAKTKSRSDFFLRQPLRITAGLWTNRPARSRHSCRRFPHLKVFFGVDRCVSQLAWTNRPARTRRSWLGRIGRIWSLICLLMFSLICSLIFVP